jgi:oxygen-independent coproporphyrinogen-3 oxidase
MYTDVSAVEFNVDLLHKYNQPLPRYTSYPPATELSSDFMRLTSGRRSPLATTNKRPYRFTATSPSAKVPATFAVATPSLRSLNVWPTPMWMP